MAKNFSVLVNIGGKLNPSLSQAVRATESKLAGLSRSLKARAAEAKASLAEIGHAAKSVAGLAAAGGLTVGVKHAIGDGAELAHEIQALKNAGRTAKEVAEGIHEANKVIGKLPTTTLAENLKILNETTGAFGDYHHALENLEFNQRIGSVLQNAVGDKAGDPGEVFNALVRAFEIRGTAADHHVYQKEVGELFKAMVFTRGNVNPHEFLNFAQQANPAIKNYSEEFLTKIAPSLIQEFGGDRAGTRAGAWYNAIMGKTRDKRMADAWVKLGLLDKKNVLTNNKNGEIIGWNPGAMKETNLAMQNPLEWTEKVLVPAMKKSGINTDDQMAVTKELGKLFRNQEANRFANAITQVRDRKRLHKDHALIDQVPDAEKAYADTLQRDPKFALKALKAAVENIGSALTAPLMEPAAKAMTAISVAVNKLAMVLVEHPNLAKALGGLAVGMSAVAAVKLASFLLGVTGLGRALTLLAIAPIAGIGAKLIGAARGLVALSAAATIGTAVRLRGIATGIVALGAAGGAKAALSGLARGLLACLMPMTLFRIGLRLTRLALIGTGIGAALVAFGAAAEFVSKNWEGMGKGVEAFGAALQKALPADLVARFSPLIEGLKGLFSGGDWMKVDDAQWQKWGETFGTELGTKVTEWTGRIDKLVDALDRLKNFKLSWSDIVSFEQSSQNDLMGQFSTWLIEQIKAKSGEFAEACKSLAKAGADAVIGFDWKATGGQIIDAIVSGVTAAAGDLAAAVKKAASTAALAVRSYLGLGGGSAPATAAPGRAPALAGERAKGGPVSAGLPYLVGENGPEIFVPQQSGRIETNGVLNKLSRAGGQAPGGLAVAVDSTAIEEAGSTAKRAGETIHASLDTTAKPVVDTTSIDAALAKVSALKGAISALGGGEGEGGSAARAGASAESGAASVAGGSSRSGASAPARVGGQAGGPAGSIGGAVRAASVGGAPAPLKGDEATRAGTIYRALRGEGFDHTHASAILGHMMEESTLNTGAYNRKEGAAGLIQWRLDRRQALERYAASRGLSVGDPRAQAGFIRHEMNGTERRSGARFMATDTIEGASAALKGYIRYGSPTAADRLAHGRRFDRMFRNGAPEAPGAAVAKASSIPGMMPGAERINPGYGVPLHKGGTGLSRYSDEDLKRMSAADAAAKAPSAAAAAKPAEAPKAAGATSTPAAKAASTPTVAVAGARAKGGPVTGGLPYLVGERGPEIFVPQATGRIATNGALKALSDETPAGLAPGQAPVDPRRDGSVQPTEAGRRLSSTLARAARGALAGAAALVSLPGDVYAGRVDPRSDEGIQRAVSLAGTLTGGGIGFAEKGAAGIFGGRLAAGADLNALKQAEALAAAGAARRDIWDKTGWFQGVDKQWRFEIHDGAARYAPEGASKLGEAMAHPALSRAYPAVAETAFRQADLLSQGAKGAFSPRRGIAVDRTLDAVAGRSTALHEAQHAVQVKEGFAGGANPKTITQGAYADWLLGRYVRGRAPAADDVAVGAFDRWRLARYRQSAGEVEARNVQRRRDMTPEQRRAVPPWETQDVADKFQVVDSAPSAVTLAGARALGGPVSGGRSYLVGENGPEIFTPGLSGAVSTNDTLNGLTAAGQALSGLGGLAGAGAVRPEGEGGLAAKIGQVAQAATGSGSLTIHHGDKTLSVSIDAGAGASPVDIARAARSELMSLLRQMESDQRGLLSD